MNRFIHATWSAFAALLFGTFFATGGYVLGHLEVPELIPTWVWNLNFTLMLLVGIAGLIYFMFRMLDEIFYPADSRQRITGRRKTPAKARPTTVTWR